MSLYSLLGLGKPLRGPADVLSLEDDPKTPRSGTSLSGESAKNLLDAKAPARGGGEGGNDGAKDAKGGPSAQFKSGGGGGAEVMSFD